MEYKYVHDMYLQKKKIAELSERWYEKTASQLYVVVVILCYHGKGKATKKEKRGLSRYPEKPCPIVRARSAIIH